MPIYSKNRPIHTVSESSVAPKFYGANDAGIILYESCVNDSIIFNAVIDHDRKEISAIKEGTILESEIEALNEEAGESLIAQIVGRLDGLWQKIKSLCTDIANKVAAYVLRDGKAYVKEFEKMIAKNGDVSFDPITLMVPDESRVSVSIKFDEGYRDTLHFKKIDKAELIAHDLAKCIGSADSGVLTPKKFRDTVEANMFKEITVSSTSDDIVGTLKQYLNNAQETLKGINKARHDAEEIVNNSKKEAKELLKDNKKASNNMSADENNANKTYWMAELALLSAKEQVISIVTNANLSVARNRISCSRKALGVIMASAKKAYKNSGNATDDEVFTDSTIYDAIVEATIEIDDAFDSNAEITPELESLIKTEMLEIGF